MRLYRLITVYKDRSTDIEANSLNETRTHGYIQYINIIILINCAQRREPDIVLHALSVRFIGLNRIISEKLPVLRLNRVIYFSEQKGKVQLRRKRVL